MDLNYLNYDTKMCYTDRQVDYDLLLAFSSDYDSGLLWSLSLSGQCSFHQVVPTCLGAFLEVISLLSFALKVQ